MHGTGVVEKCTQTQNYLSQNCTFVFSKMQTAFPHSQTFSNDVVNSQKKPLEYLLIYWRIGETGAKKNHRLTNCILFVDLPFGSSKLHWANLPRASSSRWWQIDDVWGSNLNWHPTEHILPTRTILCPVKPHWFPFWSSLQIARGTWELAPSS